MDREREYEKFFGIRTDDEEVIFDKDEKRTYSTYEASEYEGLERIFDEIVLCPEDTLVDYGCGMGRVLFYCNQRFGCRVTGVEYDHEIYDRLTENAEYYHVRFKGQERKFSLLRMKAEEYEIEPEDNFFYLFNPFSGDILSLILKRILDSVKKHPRKVTIILYYCTMEMMSVMRKYPFQLQKIIKLPAYRLDPNEKAYIYVLN